MYFKARNGSYARVPQIPNRGNTGEVGGMTVYCKSHFSLHNSQLSQDTHLPRLDMTRDSHMKEES